MHGVDAAWGEMLGPRRLLGDERRVVSNEHSPEFINAAQFVQSVIVDRPLTAGVKVSYSF